MGVIGNEAMRRVKIDWRTKLLPCTVLVLRRETVADIASRN